MTRIKSSSSFLLRIWVEPREDEDSDQVFRAYLRNLHTGEEQFVREPDALVDELRGQALRDQVVEEAGEAARAEETGRSA